ncbi:MAG: phosphatidylglycerol lysyltransferase domain-containing protein [Clostridia bacterium]
MLKFEPVTLKHFEKIYQLLSHSAVDDSAYSITSILAWQSLFHPKIHLSDDFVLMTIEEGDKIYFNSPLSKDRESYRKAVKALEDMGTTRIQLALDWQMEILDEMGYSCIKEERNMAEYLYRTEDLTTLRGKRYNSKRNFINRFNYNYKFRAYQEADFDGVMELLYKWKTSYSGSDAINPEASWSYINQNLRISDFDLEKDAIVRVLENLNDYKAVASVLEIDGRVAGFSAGELMPNGVGVVYFEKADIEYRGIYPMLDNLFVKEHFAEARLINKQEDMGLPGLRKSKLSYHPIKIMGRFVAEKC